MLTQKEVKRLFEYDATSGDLIRKVSTGNTTKIGEVAGGLHSLGYITLRVHGKRYPAHRIIWLWLYGSFPKKHIDHKDRDRANNRKDNLREACYTINNRNRPKFKNNTSGRTGVIRDKRCKSKWIARLSGAIIGRFDSFNEAVKAREEAEEKAGYLNQA